MLKVIGINKENNNTQIISLVFLGYEDNISFSKTSKSPKDMYNFNPYIVHKDYCLSLRNVYEKKTYFIRNK